MNYATTTDIAELKRPLSMDEISRANAVIPIVCASLRTEAKKVGKDLDKMVANDKDIAEVAKSVVADVVLRELMTSTNQEPMSQMSESALGYTVSGTPLVAGGGIFIKKSELARLGLRRQRYGVINLYD